MPKTGKLNEDLVDSLIDLSTQFGNKPQQQAKALYQIISSGAADAAGATEILVEANKLALGGLADLEGSVNVLTDIINVYGSENITAAEAADALFQTVKLGKTTIDQLQSSIGIVIPSAQRLGVSIDEVGAALATMTTQGLSTSQRVTQLQALFTALLKKGGDVEKQFGKKVADAFNITALRAKGLSKFLEDLEVATGGSEETIVKLVGRVEAAQAIFALTGSQLGRLNDNLDGFTSKAGAAGNAAEEIKAGLDFQLTNLTQGISNLATALGNDLGPALANIIRAFNTLAGFSEETFDLGGLTSGELENRLTLLSQKLRDAENATQGVGREFVATAEDAAVLQAEIEAIRERLDKLPAKKSILLDFQGAPADTDIFAGLDDELLGTQNKVAEDIREANLQAIADTNLREQELARSNIAVLNAIREEEGLIQEEKEIEVKLAADEATEQDLVNLENIQARKLSILEVFEKDQQTLIKKSALERQKLRQEDLKRQELVAKQVERLEQKKQQNVGNLAVAGANFISAVSADGSKTAFLISKAAAIAQSIISTNVASLQALALPPGPPFTIPLAAQTRAIGLLGTATIAATAIKGFQEGGVVGGSSFTGDRVLARVNSGETILNRAQTSNLANDFATSDSVLSSINTGIQALIAKDTSVQIDGREIAIAIRDEQRAGFAFAG